jgi:hypothetical protein
MALTKNINVEGKLIIQTPLGDIENGTRTISFPAYIKVINISGDKEQITASVNFKSDNYSLFKQYNLPVSVTNGSENFIAQVYEYLKTLSEFDGAADC